MPLPVGFKVNGSKINKSSLSIPPKIKKLMSYLDQLPAAELKTTRELIDTVAQSGGPWTNASSLADYREKVDNRLFWGSRKSIALLRKQLAEPEETNDQDQ